MRKASACSIFSRLPHDAHWLSKTIMACTQRPCSILFHWVLYAGQQRASLSVTPVCFQTWGFLKCGCSNRSSRHMWSLAYSRIQDYVERNRRRPVPKDLVILHNYKVLLSGHHWSLHSGTSFLDEKWSFLRCNDSVFDAFLVHWISDCQSSFSQFVAIFAYLSWQ